MKLTKLLLTCALVFGIAGVAAAQTADPVTPAPEATTALATSDSEISVSGEVVSSTSTELVIDSDAGQRMTFALDPATTRATTFTEGERVTVQYQTASSGTVFQAASVTVEPQDTFDRDVDRVPASSSDRLPDTAGALPLIGLLGFLAVGGAVAVRLARS